MEFSVQIWVDLTKAGTTPDMVNHVVNMAVLREFIKHDIKMPFEDDEEEDDEEDGEEEDTQDFDDSQQDSASQQSYIDEKQNNKLNFLSKRVRRMRHKLKQL